MTANDSILAKKVLVVDDEEEVVSNLIKIFKRAGYEAIGTTRGKEAIHIASAQLPDLILLDIVMPDMYGEDVAAVLLKNEKTAQIPIVFLTGLLDKSEEARFKKNSPRYFLMAKPVISTDLLALIKTILNPAR